MNFYFTFFFPSSNVSYKFFSHLKRALKQWCLDSGWTELGGLSQGFICVLQRRVAYTSGSGGLAVLQCIFCRVGTERAWRSACFAERHQRVSQLIESIRGGGFGPRGWRWRATEPPHGTHRRLAGKIRREKNDPKLWGCTDENRSKRGRRADGLFFCFRAPCCSIKGNRNWGHN